MHGARASARFAAAHAFLRHRRSVRQHSRPDPANHSTFMHSSKCSTSAIALGPRRPDLYIATIRESKLFCSPLHSFLTVLKVAGVADVLDRCSACIAGVHIGHHRLQWSSKQRWDAVMCADPRELVRRDGRNARCGFCKHTCHWRWTSQFLYMYMLIPSSMH